MYQFYQNFAKVLCSKLIDASTSEIQKIDK